MPFVTPVAGVKQSAKVHGPLVVSLQPLPTSEVEKFVDEINSYAVDSKTTSRTEYSFQLQINPWQHPMLDRNIHHLLAILTALSNDCGGFVYLATDPCEMQLVAHEIFEQFKQRLLHQITKMGKLSVDIDEPSEQLRQDKVWATIWVREIQGAVHYPTGLCKPTEFRMGLSGQVEFSRSKQESLEETQLVSQEEASYSEQPVDFFSYQRLDWSENKKDWQNCLNMKEIDTDVANCNMWKPSQPMRVTPNTDTLQYLFNTREQMEQTMSEVETKEPGFAIVCKTWRFHVSAHDAEPDIPQGQICDIITVTKTGKVNLWGVVDYTDDMASSYLKETGRMLKYQLLKKGPATGLSHLFINCYLICPMLNTMDRPTSLPLNEAQEVENRDVSEENIDFAALQHALAMVIMSRESPLKRCISDEISIVLSTKQAEVLMNKAKVNYISGPAGSGKSWTAACLYNMYGKDKSVYICTTHEFVEFLKMNGYKGTLVQNDQDLLREISEGTFQQKSCIVIDDSHNFACTKSSLKKLFMLLKQNWEMSLFIFADNEYQSFDRKRQEAMRGHIFDLTRRFLGTQSPSVLPLTEIYRNTKKVVSFVQSAIQETYDGHRGIQCANPVDGDGVECIKMNNVWENGPSNDLVVYLRSLLDSRNYNPTEIAILFDPSYTETHIGDFSKILNAHAPEARVQRARVFPQQGVVVDYLDRFLGLDSKVCIFILPNTPETEKDLNFFQRFFQRILRPADSGCDTSICNPQYRVFMASRATHRAVFVVPQIKAELVQQMKFDYFKVCKYPI